MSKHLAFWNYNKGIYLNNRQVYTESCCSLEIEGLVKLPIGAILDRTEQKFSDWQKLDDYSYESDRGSFTIITTPTAVIFDCGEGMQVNDLNKIIDIMLEFDCPCYSPEINVRFDGI